MPLLVEIIYALEMASVDGASPLLSTVCHIAIGRLSISIRHDAERRLRRSPRSIRYWQILFRHPGVRALVQSAVLFDVTRNPHTVVNR